MKRIFLVPIAVAALAGAASMAQATPASPALDAVKSAASVSKRSQPCAVKRSDPFAFVAQPASIQRRMLSGTPEPTGTPREVLRPR